MKARGADRIAGVREGEVGRVEAKLMSLGEVRGIVCGNWGEVSEDTHALLHTMALSRVRVAGPSTGRRGRLRSEEGERAVVMGYLRRTLGVATVKAQCSSLLGRLEGLGPGKLLLQVAANRLLSWTDKSGFNSKLIRYLLGKAGPSTGGDSPKQIKNKINISVITIVFTRYKK